MVFLLLWKKKRIWGEKKTSILEFFGKSFSYVLPLEWPSQPCSHSELLGLVNELSLYLVLESIKMDTPKEPHNPSGLFSENPKCLFGFINAKITTYLFSNLNTPSSLSPTRSFHWKCLRWTNPHWTQKKSSERIVTWHLGCAHLQSQ